MSFSWSAVDEREKNKNKYEKEKQLKDFLRAQQEEVKDRKIKQKRDEVEEFQKLLGMPIRVPGSNASRATNAYKVESQPDPAYIAPAASGRSPLHIPPATRAETRPDYSQLVPLPPLPSTSSSNNSYTPSIPFHSVGANSYDSNRAADLESQLSHERRLRTQLENELHSGKSVLAAVSAKVDNLSAALTASQAALHSVSRQAADADRRSRELESAIRSLDHASTSNTRQMSSELVTRQKRFEENNREEEATRFRALTEELARLRYQVEGLQMQTAESGQDFRAKTEDLHHDSRIGVDAMRIARAHDSAISALHSAVETNLSAIDRRVEMGIGDVKLKLDHESRARDKDIRDLHSELSKLIHNRDRETTDRLDNLRISLTQLLDAERSEREKGSANILEHIQAVERARVQESDDLRNQIQRADSAIGEERQSRMAAEGAARVHCQELISDMQLSFAKRISEIQLMQDDLKHGIGSVAKGLQSSIVLAEKTVQQRSDSLEQVVRAEIKLRMETSQRLQEHVAKLESSFALGQNNILDLLAKRDQDSTAAHVGIESEFSHLIDQLSQAQARNSDEVARELKMLRSQVKTLDAGIQAVGDAFESKLRQHEAGNEDAVQDLRSLLDSEMDALRLTQDDRDRRLANFQAASQDCVKGINEKIDSKVIQFDQTLQSYKKDINARVTKSFLEANITRLDSVLGQIEEGMTAIQGELSDKVAKSEVNKFQSRMEELLSQAIQNLADSEQVSASKGSLDALEKRLTDILIGIQTREVSIIEHLSELETGLKGRVTRSEIDEATKKLSTTMKAQLKEHMATKRELNDLDERLQKLSKDVIEELQGAQDVIQSNDQETRNVIDKVVAQTFAKGQIELDNIRDRLGQYDSQIELIRADLGAAGASVTRQFARHVEREEERSSKQNVEIQQLRQSFEDRFHQLDERLEDFYNQSDQTQATEAAIRESEREELQAHIDRLVHQLSEIRNNLAARVDQATYQKNDRDLRNEIRALSTHMESDFVTAERLRARLLDAEHLVKERHKELRTLQERTLVEQMQVMRQWRDTTCHRLDSLEVRLTSLAGKDHERSDGAQHSYENNARDVDRKLQNETTRLRTEMANIEMGLYNALRAQIERVDQEISQKRGNTPGESHLQHGQASTGKRGPNDMPDTRDHQALRTTAIPMNSSQRPDTEKGALVPGTFYKPPHLALTPTATSLFEPPLSLDPKSSAASREKTLSPPASTVVEDTLRHTQHATPTTNTSIKGPSAELATETNIPQRPFQVPSDEVLPSFPESAVGLDKMRHSLASAEVASASTSMSDLLSNHPAPAGNKHQATHKIKTMEHPTTVNQNTASSDVPHTSAEKTSELERLADLASSSHQLLRGDSFVQIPSSKTGEEASRSKKPSS